MSTKQEIRTIVRGAYDIQKLRISTGNRVANNFRAKLGQEPSKKASDGLSVEAKKTLSQLKKDYKRITDGLIKSNYKGPFPGTEIISSYTEFALVSQYVELEQVEKDHFKRVGIIINDIPIYKEFLEDIHGIGPAMAGVIISEFDIHKAKYPSSLCKYAGIDVVLDVDGLGRSKRKNHLVKVQYTNKKGEEVERDSITYNAFLKTKLMGVLADSFLKSDSYYKQFYYNYRHRIETDPNRIITDKTGFHTDNTWTKMRRHQAAKRYMIKIFLIDLYKKWRALEGLPVAPDYHETKHGHVHNSQQQIGPS